MVKSPNLWNRAYRPLPAYLPAAQEQASGVPGGRLPVAWARHRGGSTLPVIRLEICTEHLSIDQRENLLDAVWDALRISPGMVTADGNVELALCQCGAGTAPEDAPLVRVDGQEYRAVTPERLITLMKRWSR